MFLTKNHEQTILEISQRDYINATADSFLIDLCWLLDSPVSSLEL